MLLERLLDRILDPLARALGHLTTHHRAPELLVAMVIIVGWTVVAYLPLGSILLVVALVLMSILHYVAADTGRFGWLWLATGAVVLCVIVAYSDAGVLSGQGPLVLTAGGSTALVYNECVRLNQFRRRNPVIGPSIYPMSALAVIISCGIGFGGVALTIGVIDGPARPWTWLPATVAVLFVVTVGLLVVPGRLAPHRSRERWKPGSRIPPSPIVRADGLGVQREAGARGSEPR